MAQQIRQNGWFPINDTSNNQQEKPNPSLFSELQENTTQQAEADEDAYINNATYTPPTTLPEPKAVDTDVFSWIDPQQISAQTAEQLSGIAAMQQRTDADLQPIPLTLTNADGTTPPPASNSVQEVKDEGDTALREVRKMHGNTTRNTAGVTSQAATQDQTNATVTQRELTPDVLKQAHEIADPRYKEYMKARDYVPDGKGGWEREPSLADALTADRSKIRENREKEEKYNRLRQIEDALYKSGALISDIISAVHPYGTVRQREDTGIGKKATEENRALRAQQLQDDAANAEKDRKDKQEAMTGANQIMNNTFDAYTQFLAPNKQDSTMHNDSAAATSSTEATKGTTPTDGGGSRSSSGGGGGGSRSNGGGTIALRVSKDASGKGERNIEFIYDDDKEALSKNIWNEVNDALKLGDNARPTKAQQDLVNALKEAGICPKIEYHKGWGGKYELRNPEFAKGMDGKETKSALDILTSKAIRYSAVALNAALDAMERGTTDGVAYQHADGTPCDRYELYKMLTGLDDVDLLDAKTATGEDGKQTVIFNKTDDGKYKLKTGVVPNGFYFNVPDIEEHNTDM